MKIKHIREIKVGIVAVVCLFLLYFGFNFLKGVNIFSPVHNFYGTYAAVNGLTEQSPVYIRGYKVGQVDWIHYDFTADSAFTVRISVNKDISLPKGTTMDLIADGLLGGGAVQLSVPTATQAGFATSSENYESGDFLPTQVIPGLMDNLSSGLLGNLDSTILAAKVLIKNVNNQLADDHLHSALARIDSLSGELTVSSHALSQLLTQRVSGIVDNLDTTLANVSVITTDVRNANLAATVGRVDTVVEHVNILLADVRAQKGTLGQLLYDKSLYANVNTTVQSADSLLVDLKANPRRYMHFSLFGGKDKSDKKKNKARK